MSQPNNSKVGMGINIGAIISIIALPILNFKIFDESANISVAKMVSGFFKANDLVSQFGFNLDVAQLLDISGMFGISAILIGVAILLLAINVLMDVSGTHKSKTIAWLPVAVIVGSILCFYIGVEESKSLFFDLSHVVSFGAGLWFSLVLCFISGIIHASDPVPAKRSDNPPLIRTETLNSFCHQCGEKNESRDSFCQSCGAKQ